MDMKVSRKEARYQPQGLVEVLVDDVFDIYPVYGNPFDRNLITDIEILDNPNTELLDRAMFAVVKQRGLDPTEPLDGIQWAETISGEVPVPLLLSQVVDAVSREGPGVRITPSIVMRSGKPVTNFIVELTSPVR